MPGPELFRFAVTRVFTIERRGTVAVGLVEAGAVRVGDPVVLVHGERRVRTRCVAVLEGIRAVPPIEEGAFGLLLDGVTELQVSAGDHIVADERQ